MGDLTTYAPAHFIPFTAEVYLRMFVRLNRAVWPLHLATTAAAAAAGAALRFGRARLTAALLVPCWAGVGYAYFLRRYAEVNWAGSYIGAAFFCQAALLIWGVATGRFARRDGPAERVSEAVGFGLAGLAVGAYPFLGLLAGRRWGGAEVVGMAPDPTALATIGLALAADRARWEVWITPVSWCAASGITGYVVGSTSSLVAAAAGITAAVAALGTDLLNGAAGRRR